MPSRLHAPGRRPGLRARRRRARRGARRGRNRQARLLATPVPLPRSGSGHRLLITGLA
ncbi:hypothetical protein PSCLAVI8L_130693 [Pseudoclavibacter sp. 8L]|nr:hypothetical protein PSCLAVI8L_130693 [Pseudoclavibacter sp. 8L]